jgi:CRP-like cAMP-binding protein
MLSIAERIHFLEEIPSFRSLTEQQLASLADFCEAKTFAAGSPIFRQGELGESLFMVVDGQVGIEREVSDENDTVALAIIKPCEYFGLFSLFSQAPRSATASAMKDSVVLEIKRGAFVTFARQNPDLLIELNHVLTTRLVEAYDKIEEMTRKRGKPRELRKLYEKLDF